MKVPAVSMFNFPAYVIVIVIIIIIIIIVKLWGL